jgi:glyoxylase-like metal-dependent hydrolase (beta-lactamase superfamily II)
MKRLVMIAIISALLPSCGGRAEESHIGEVVFDNGQVAFTKLEENMWVGETYDNTTLYIVEGTDSAALIDTGTKLDSLDVVVRAVTDKPLKVILTHMHPDHAGNIDFFPEIYMHPADTVLIRQRNIQYGGKINFLKDGDIIDLGKVKLDVALVPGHTPGSIVLNDFASGNCYAGDAFGSGQVWLQVEPTSPVATYIESCDRMIAIMDNTTIDSIYCGHYPYLKRALDKDYVKSMKTLAERIVEGSAPTVPFQQPGPFARPEMKIAVDSLGGTMIVFNETKIL